MSMNSYIGMGDELAINPECVEEVHQSMDFIHTCVMDNLSEEEQQVLLPILEGVMRQIEDKYPEKDFWL